MVTSSWTPYRANRCEATADDRSRPSDGRPVGRPAASVARVLDPPSTLHTEASGVRPVQRRDLVAQVRDAIIELIRVKDMNPGDQLPSEGQLHKELGVGRSTVREAVRILVHLGVVETRQGQGTFVGRRRVVPGESLADRLVDARVPDVHEARRAMEMEAVSLAAERRTDDDLKAMRDVLKTCRAAVAQKDMERFAEADRSFHTLVVRAAGNPVLIGLYGELSDVLLTTMQELAPLGDLDNPGHVHDQIFDAILERKPAAARKALRTHLAETQRRLNRALGT
jgi:GntR family transcriptional repressor for pyruvate dehydrogenase complex